MSSRGAVDAPRPDALGRGHEAGQGPGQRADAVHLAGVRQAAGVHWGPPDGAQDVREGRDEGGGRPRARRAVRRGHSEDGAEDGRHQAGRGAGPQAAQQEREARVRRHSRRQVPLIAHDVHL